MISLDVISVVDPIRAEWRESLTTSAPTVTGSEPFNLHGNEIKLRFNGENVVIETVVSKTVYKEFRNRIITPVTAELNFNICKYIFLSMMI